MLGRVAHILNTHSRVVGYYEQFDEWGRLDTPAGRLEFERTLAYVLGSLSPASSVLDLGGGPGRYAIGLAAQGHTVSLVDLSPKLVEEARARVDEAGLQERVPHVSVGCAENLSSFSTGHFDAVLALGPFYHLTEPSDRVNAATEMLRVLRPGGVAYVAFIPRACGIAGLVLRAAQDPAQVPSEAIERVFADGVFINPTRRGFQSGYYPQVAEIESLFRDAGFAPLDLFSIRGLYFGEEAAAESLRARAPLVAEAFDRGLTKLARERDVIALSGHALLVLRKPEARMA
jgi:S-adenosylmethionine-dependent methyltransferase